MACPCFAYLSVLNLAVYRFGVWSLVDDIAGIRTGYGSHNSIMGVALISAALVSCGLIYHSNYAMPCSRCLISSYPQQVGSHGQQLEEPPVLGYMIYISDARFL